MIRAITIFLTKFFFAAALLYPASLLPSQINGEFSIQWRQPQHIGEENQERISFLYFDEAIYTDFSPGVPIKVHRQATTPHFKTQFEFIALSTEPATQEESEILSLYPGISSDFVLSDSQEISQGKIFSKIEIVPVRYRDGKYEKLTRYSLNSTEVYHPEFKQLQIKNYPENSVLATGNWYRVCVSADGIYRIGKKELESLGINPAGVNKSSIQLFGTESQMLSEAASENLNTDLQEIAIWVSGQNSGAFGDDDYILFYGQSPHNWSYNDSKKIFEYQQHYYSNEKCYFLTFDQQNGKRVENRVSSSATPTATVTDFFDYQHHEKDVQNLLGSGKIWYGELFEVTLQREFPFVFQDISTGHPAVIKANVASRSSSVSSFTLTANGVSKEVDIATVNMNSSTGIFAREGNIELSLNNPNDLIDIKLDYNRYASGSQGWLNYITINARRMLNKTDHQLFFRNPAITVTASVARYEITTNTTVNTIWDITNPLNPINQNHLQQGNQASFVVETANLQQLVVFDHEEFPAPALKGLVPNQNLHALATPDLVILTPDIFWSEGQRLADHRKTIDGLDVVMVSPQQIYNEFSGGTPDISAIRDFMKMFYDRASETGEYPRYLLLFGNGTYDNKNVLGYGGNLIPTFQTLQSLSHSSSYISDDFFGLLDFGEGEDAQGSIDIGIGRFPVRTTDEARFVVDKILRYDQRIPGLEPGTDNPLFAGVISNYSDWRNIVSIIGDDQDGNIHFNQSEQIANYMTQQHPTYNVEKIYLDVYEQTTLAGGSRYPEVNSAINRRVNQGALLINYIGHGGTLGLAHERILTFDDILSWGNFYNLPVFMTATCEFSSFDQPDANELSAGVRVFLKPNGGASALFTTTRLAYAGPNFSLNLSFMKNAFIPMEDGEMPRLGDLIRISKVESSSLTTLKNFVLLGDPSMQMAYPRLKAVTTQVPDTIKALEHVTIKGEIHDENGVLASGYNGVIYPTIFDKQTTLTTRANDSDSSPENFTVQDKIIYRGTASVTNGQFEFSFIVPRDISYLNGTGKTSYYFDDGELYDGAGYFNEFVISGTSNDYAIDNDGPVINIYLDNTNFRSGDKTGPNPLLIALLEDESGINTTGQIGHDIVAFLDNETSRPIILNNFYQTDINSYKSGRIVFPLYDLEKGEHTLTLRAWDAHNNMNTSSIDFIVGSAPGIELTSVLNKPNPFSYETVFSIQHNKPATELNISIDIYSITGQRVKNIEQNVYASGFNIPPINWDGSDNGGTPLQSGMYFYTVRVTTNSGDEVSNSQKLLIMR